MTDYKTEIIESHKRGFGSSDAKEIIKLANTGIPSSTLLKRIHAIKNGIEREQITTKAMNLGDEIEMRIYEMLEKGFVMSESDATIQSNPLWVMPDAGYPFSIFCHPDQVVITDTEVLILENKASIKTIEHWQQEALAQVAWQYMCAESIYLGKEINARLVHYDTNDYLEFDSSKISQRDFSTTSLQMCMHYEITKGLEMLANNWDALEYTEGESLDLNKVDESLPVVADYKKLEAMVIQSKEIENQIDSFKE